MSCLVTPRAVSLGLGTGTGGYSVYLYAASGRTLLLLYAALATMCSCVVAVVYAPGVSDAIGTYARHRWPVTPDRPPGSSSRVAKTAGTSC